MICQNMKASTLTNFRSTNTIDFGTEYPSGALRWALRSVCSAVVFPSFLIYIYIYGSRQLKKNKNRVALKKV